MQVESGKKRSIIALKVVRCIDHAETFFSFRSSDSSVNDSNRFLYLSTNLMTS
jgi:hypothetical protein